MKRICFMSVFSLLFLLGTLCCADTLVMQDQLPTTASDFLNTHFPEQTIGYIERDGLEYNVNFSNGWEVEFNRRGEWHHVDCRRDPVPASIQHLLPQLILTYVATHFSTAAITEVDKDAQSYEIGLSNDLDLRFSLSGNFKRID